MLLLLLLLLFDRSNIDLFFLAITDDDDGDVCWDLAVTVATVGGVVDVVVVIRTGMSFHLHGKRGERKKQKKELREKK